MKKQLNNVEIHYLTKKKYLEIPENNPYIDKIYCIEKNISEVTEDLKKENYTHIIDLHHNLRTFIVKHKLCKPSHSFDKLNIEKWIYVNFKINILPEIHIVDRYMNTVKFLGVTNDNKGLDYFIPQVDEVDLNRLPQNFRNGYIGFVIGGLQNTKCFPVEKIISVCKKINYPVIILGGKNDFEKGEQIAEEVGDNIFNACGKYNINQSASIVRQAKKIITNDTGLMHIASAFKKDIISLWGNTVPAFGMYPYLPGEKSKIIEINEIRCRPCSKLGFVKCPYVHFKCMKMIDEEEIIKLLN
ncbi:MAG: glycosyltransferase family 9 protein [Bacteroidales bacterium]|nr:glycosyltransferase family 9 protein [Bacteroidales bacterium]